MFAKVLFIICCSKYCRIKCDQGVIDKVDWLVQEPTPSIFPQKLLADPVLANLVNF